MPIMAEPSLKTARLGGVEVPSADTLKTMHDSAYILHACAGKLSEVPVEKTLFTGSYAGSVTLEDDWILSVLGSSQAGNSWEMVRDNTDFYAIRWRPVEWSKG